ncbi:MAG: NCS2 family permease [Tannerellaceae bacterium]|jgi:AGZA family xanthine/uracil permease-like MFS transporter|nr:NCS2 family permease [Tannerellaceae bacterium]
MKLYRLCGFNPQTMTVRTELLAGLTTFLTMCYILAVNPAILGTTGMDRGAVFTATALTAAIGTLLLAFMARYPFALASSMALNAFFAFTLVGGMGYSWETALAAMFVEGILILAVTLLNVREMILNAIPAALRHAIPAGIGMFIAFIGLKNAGILASSPATLITLGAFTPSAVLAMAGILVCGILTARKIKGALFYGILACTLAGIPLGVTSIPDGFLPVALPQSPEPTFLHLDFAGLLSPDMLIVIFILLFMNIFDTAGTLVGLASRAGVIDKDGRIPRAKQVMLADAIATTVGATLGATTTTTYVESAAGIAEGGRSGLTSLTTGIFFLAALFFSPLFLLIPPAAVTGALVLVGALMLDAFRKVNTEDITEALPAFVTILMMPLTSSIADGMILGILSFVAVKLCAGRRKDVSPVMFALAILFVLYYIFI